MSKFLVGCCTCHKISDGKLNNGTLLSLLVFGIHGRYYLDVCLFRPLISDILAHSLSRFIRPDEMAAKPWYVIACPILITLVSPFGELTSNFPDFHFSVPGLSLRISLKQHLE